jgi:hypothetical protein
MLRYSPSIPSFLTVLIMKWCWILAKAFSVSIKMIKWFLSLLLLMCCITFIDLCMLNHPASLGRSWLGCGEWYFWFVFGFSLPLFYWGFLHRYSLRRLVYSSPFCMCLCFGDECNTGFIEWAGSIPSLSISQKSLRRVGISSLTSDRIQQKIHQFVEFSFFGDFMAASISFQGMYMLMWLPWFSFAWS